MKLRERFWLWGHPEGRYNHEYGNEQESRMTPMEGCLYLGIKNTFMVPVGVNVNRRQDNKSFKTLRHVGWECYNAGEHPEIVEPLITEAADFPNINCVVFDVHPAWQWCTGCRHRGQDLQERARLLQPSHPRLH
nr:hypothetical protein [Clostridia bacterium]